jgi:hypothetical protein
MILVLTDEATIPCPFWRESAYEFTTAFPAFTEHWSRLLPVSSDRTLDVSSLPWNGEWQVLLNRIDVRTYRETPVVARLRTGSLHVLATSLRPFGGLGSQPTSLLRNPAGCTLLRALVKEFD